MEAMFLQVCLMAYLLGSIPFGYLLAQEKGINIQKVGSGATGSTNVARALGKPAAVVTFVADAFKLFLAVFLAKYYFTENWIIYFVAVLAIIGHIVPPWPQLKFRGGKGVASLVGALLALDFKVALVWGASWLILLGILFLVIKISKADFKEWMSSNNLLTLWYLPALFWLCNHHAWDWMIFSFVLTGIIYFAHHENIGRIIKSWRKSK